MEFGPSFVAAQSAPIPVADTRPSADVAASKKTTEPELKFAAGTNAPPTTSQAAATSRSLMLATEVEDVDKTRSVSSDRPVERTLKPYGVAMLPETAENTEPQETSEDESDTAVEEPVP